MKETTRKIFRQLLKDGAIRVNNLPNPVRHIEGGKSIIYCIYKEDIHECIIDTININKIAIGRVWCAQGRKDRKEIRVVCGNKNNDIVHLSHLLLYDDIMQRDRKKVIDYIDRNTLNNTITNLRIVTKKEDMLNKGTYKSNKTGRTGIIKKHNGKYAINILREFLTKEGAEKAMDEIEQILTKYKNE